MSITMKLQGGLGNQMFQYAAGIGFAGKLGVELKLDVSKLLNDSARRYSLNLFKGVNQQVVTDSKANVFENGLPYQELNVKDGDTIVGYFQSEKYFENVKHKIRTTFVSAKPVPDNLSYFCDAMEKIDDAGDRSTFLTVRRTDYLTRQDFHGLMSFEYYCFALNAIRDHIQTTPRVFVFSDDPAWCKTELYLPYHFEVIDSHDFTTPDHLGREDVDLYLMSQCRHGVMANSSFSWWGAWLGDTQRNRKIIAPKKWFVTDTVDSKDIVPDRWTLL